MRLSVRSLRRAGVVAATLAVAAGVLVPAGPLGAATPTCGGEKPARSGGGTWHCSFDDEFSGTAINRAAWTVQATSQHGWHSGNECVADSPQTVSVSGGHLNLTVRSAGHTFTCTSPSGNFRTSNLGASVYTKAFAQQYGRFEIRAKFSNGAGVRGVQGALWTYPANRMTSTVLAGPTEIDIAEHYTVHQNLVIPTVHSWTAPLGASNNNCSVAGDETGFHTYTLTWTPSTVIVQYDNKTCLNMAAPLSISPAGTHPFIVALSQTLGIGADSATGATRLPQTEQIDYVRVWK